MAIVGVQVTLSHFVLTLRSRLIEEMQPGLLSITLTEENRTLGGLTLEIECSSLERDIYHFQLSYKLR